MSKKIILSFLAGMAVTGLFSFTAEEYQRGDVNQDGFINVADVTCLIHFILNGNWPDEPVTPPNETFTVNGVTFTMVGVQGGTFLMGGTEEQGSFAEAREFPVHEVTLSSYSIGQTEVTQALWVAVMGSNPSWYTSVNGYNDNLERPVTNVSWRDCRSFINRLNQLTGRNFRFPTEAEGEFAARGGNLSKGYMYAGSDNIDEVAWYWNTLQSHTEGDDGYGPQPVATKAPNELGIYDMSGNVFEWCLESPYDYTSEPQVDPVGPSEGNDRLCRFGCWVHSARDCRVSYRYTLPVSRTSGVCGLRLAL